MPFPKLRLKKSKQQYNVASKAMYVITVELLDNNQLECTLTAESTGKHHHHRDAEVCHLTSFLILANGA